MHCLSFAFSRRASPSPGTRKFCDFLSKSIGNALSWTEQPSSPEKLREILSAYVLRPSQSDGQLSARGFGRGQFVAGHLIEFRCPLLKDLCKNAKNSKHFVMQKFKNSQKTESASRKINATGHVEFYKIVQMFASWSRTE